MAYFERIKDVITEPLSATAIEARQRAGWQMVAVEWRRELPGDESPSEGAFSDDIPYGLRISEDCRRLEIDAAENQALTLMMEGMVQDSPYESIVSDLNEKGFRMRDGRPWSRVSIFKMLPRLIEVGPRLFSGEEWKARQQRLVAKAR